ncbi:TonB-dependent receptor [Dyella psychrodurans]|uniref:TonB-dependent receptor n=1 Tax=Dyella psychrodurans TaxID=1927960 RepID=A0A370XD11_9GAMM|nr:TonB-dependent receptor [Dyella psychrodurans]RDS86147.1 TonB-dependent receptor [Dyella psychrodurans]
MSSCKQIGRRALTVAIGAMLMAGAAQAQNTTSQPAAASSADQGQNKAKTARGQGGESKQEATTLNQVVVTGNTNFGGIRKIDASYSTTSATSEQIKELNPISTADLLKMSPGIYPESSGGQTGANIEVAGFPSDSGAPFVTLQLNGSPLFPQWEYFTDAMFRLDDSIDRVETVQGGPSVLFGNGQPGLIANFILKEGTSTPGGDVGVTYGSEGMVRLDGFYGFPLFGKDSGWYGSIGGFWRKSDGVRDPQFAADKGGQLTATLSHDLEYGSIMFYARELQDKNQFVTDTPIYNPAPGKFSPYPGFNPLTGTFGSNADRYQFLQTTPCFTPGCSPAGVNIDMANGQGGDVHMVGGNLDLDFQNGWSLSDKFILVGGNMDTTAFFSTGENPMTLGSFISSSEAAFGLPSNLAATATYTNGKPANMNENVTVQNPEYIHKHIQSVSNEFHISKDLFDGNTLTLGNYTAVYSESHSENDGLNMLMQSKTNPNPIVVNLSDGTNTYQLTDGQGLFWNNQPQSWMAFNERWHATTTAAFAADTWNIGNWRFDGGARVQYVDINGWFQNTTSGDLDANPYTVYNNDAEYLINSFQHPSYSKSATSWTVGANYAINNNMSVYARVNDGVFLPTFDNIQPLPSTPVEKIHNMELGFKYQSPWIYADISAYRRLFHGVPYSITLDTGQINLVYGSTTKGLNTQVILTPFKHFTVSLSGDYMDGHYSGYDSCVPYVAQNGNNECSSINGMDLDRQPKVQYRVTPAYEIPTSWGSMKFWLTYEHVGNRFSDQLEQQPLGSYYDLAIGAIANIGQNWMLTLRGTNMTNQIGVTEGNARLFGFASGGGVILARSIEGREVNFQAKYKF